MSKTAIVVGVQLIVAGMLVAGAGLADPSLKIMYQSYFADVAIPFGLYFLLAMRVRRPWWMKAGAIFALCAASETLQFFGIFALARVFDPVDYIMYGLGVLLAAGFDRQIFSRLFPAWDLETRPNPSPARQTEQRL